MTHSASTLFEDCHSSSITELPTSLESSWAATISASSTTSEEILTTGILDIRMFESSSPLEVTPSPSDSQVNAFPGVVSGTASVSIDDEASSDGPTRTDPGQGVTATASSESIFMRKMFPPTNPPTSVATAEPEFSVFISIPTLISFPDPNPSEDPDPESTGDPGKRRGGSIDDTTDAESAPTASGSNPRLPAPTAIAGGAFNGAASGPIPSVIDGTGPGGISDTGSGSGSAGGGTPNDSGSGDVTSVPGPLPPVAPGKQPSVDDGGSLAGSGNSGSSPGFWSSTGTHIGGGAALFLFAIAAVAYGYKRRMRFTEPSKKTTPQELRRSRDLDPKDHPSVQVLPLTASPRSSPLDAFAPPLTPIPYNEYSPKHPSLEFTASPNVGDTGDGTYALHLSSDDSLNDLNNTLLAPLGIANGELGGWSSHIRPGSVTTVLDTSSDLASVRSAGSEASSRYSTVWTAMDAMLQPAYGGNHTHHNTSSEDSLSWRNSSRQSKGSSCVTVDTSFMSEVDSDADTELASTTGSIYTASSLTEFTLKTLSRCSSASESDVEMGVADEIVRAGYLR
ncbi:hypothetical protein HDU85_002602 [Gaertneriomyces sp. JEL0708]|nr:hypothetical protein HDU85_002602 [Gaertneriomyces sp. JEL0708]